MVIEKKVIIKNKSGLHARPAADFVQKANKYNSKIFLVKGEQKVNGKSIMGILTLAAEQNSVVTLIAEGIDAQLAIIELSKILESEI